MNCLIVMCVWEKKFLQLYNVDRMSLEMCWQLKLGCACVKYSCALTGHWAFQLQVSLYELSCMTRSDRVHHWLNLAIHKTVLPRSNRTLQPQSTYKGSHIATASYIVYMPKHSCYSHWKLSSAWSGGQSLFEKLVRPIKSRSQRQQPSGTNLTTVSRCHCVGEMVICRWQSGL